MGSAITWCAFREDKAEQFLNQLGLFPTGETEEFPLCLIEEHVMASSAELWSQGQRKWCPTREKTGAL